MKRKGVQARWVKIKGTYIESRTPDGSHREFGEDWRKTKGSKKS
jgi:hypothetical protein